MLRSIMIDRLSWAGLAAGLWSRADCHSSDRVDRVVQVWWRAARYGILIQAGGRGGGGAG